MELRGLGMCRLSATGLLNQVLGALGLNGPNTLLAHLETVKAPKNPTSLMNAKLSRRSSELGPGKLLGHCQARKFFGVYTQEARQRVYRYKEGPLGIRLGFLG